MLSQLQGPKNCEKKEQRIIQNRLALTSIIETVLFCGEEELPLRGDGDHGPHTLEKPILKDGNFRGLLRYRAAGGDVNLKNHIIDSPKNASYVSPDIQNEIISIVAEILQEKIVSKVNEAEIFSILADETMDMENACSTVLALK